MLGGEIGCECAGVEPCPERGKVSGDVCARVLGEKAVVGEDGYAVGTVDEWDEEGSDSGGEEAVACYLGLLVFRGFV